MWAISSYFHSNYCSQMGLGWVTPSTHLYISTTNQAPRYYHIYIQHEPTARNNLQEDATPTTSGKVSSRREEQAVDRPAPSARLSLSTRS
jgi:hypothetical protein